jgi:hypothetical protein
MGKRELFIILGFIVVGALAFQFTAPPATGTSSFSLGNFFNQARREMRGNPGRAVNVTKASIPVTPGLREVRLSGINEGVTIIGDSKTTIEYELSVSSTGPDDAGALALAKETVLLRDDVADSLALKADYPEPGSQRSTLTMHVPPGMSVRLESSTGATITAVAGVHLEAMRGRVTLADISGGVTGAHQDGDLTITGAQSIKLRLLRSKSRLSKVTDGLTLDARDGDTEVTESAGAMEVDEIRNELTVTDHRGPIAVRGNDGRVTIRQPQADTRVDVRRAEVEVEMSRAVPLTLITSDEPLRLILEGAPAFTLDAAASNAAIQAVDFDLKPEISESDARLSHVFGAKSDVKITLRNTRGDIILRKK